MKAYAFLGLLLAAMANAGSVELKYGTKFCRTPYAVCMLPRLLYAFERDESLTTLKQMRERFEYERNVCQCKVIHVPTQKDRCSTEGYTCDASLWNEKDEETWDDEPWGRISPKEPKLGDTIWGHDNQNEWKGEEFPWKRDALPQLVVPDVEEPSVVPDVAAPSIPSELDASPRLVGVKEPAREAPDPSQLIVPADGKWPTPSQLEANHDIIHRPGSIVPGIVAKREEAENQTFYAPERPMEGVPVPELPISKEDAENELVSAPERPIENVSVPTLPIPTDGTNNVIVSAPERPMESASVPVLPRSANRANEPKFHAPESAPSIFPFPRLPRSAERATNDIVDKTVRPFSGLVIPAELPGAMANDVDVAEKRAELEEMFATWLAERCTASCGGAADCPEWCSDRRLFWQPESPE